MNAAHLHLIINHIPVMGFAIALLFYLVALINRNDVLIKAALWMFLLIALAAIPVYLTGDPAEEYIEDFAGVPHDIVHEHEESAEVAFVSALVLGLLSIMGLINFRRRRHLSKMFLIFVLLVAVVVAAFMASAANQGGQIRHPEARPEIAQPAATESVPILPDTTASPPEQEEGESSHDD